MRGKTRIISHALAGTALLAAFSIAPVRAQSLNSWSLPTPEASSTTSSAQGPVDDQNPVIRPAAPEPRPAPSSVPSAVPTISPPAAPSPTASATARPAARPTPAPAPAMAGQGAEPAPAQPSPVVTETAADAPEPLPAPVASEPAATPAPVKQGQVWPFWGWALPAGLAVLVAAFLLLRRRSVPEEDIEAEEIELREEPARPPERPVAGDDRPARPAALTPTFSPRAQGQREGARASGDLTFEPVTMRLSLVYATLQFRFTLTARTEIPPGRLLADMISAHASLPQAVQLAPPPKALGMVGAVPRMAPGEKLELKGEVQIPLNAVRTVQRGEAAFMVPLVRLALIGDDLPDLPHLELGFVFTVGLPGDGPALAPLRFDTGPRDITGLDAREIESARRTVLPGLDPAAAAG